VLRFGAADAVSTMFLDGTDALDILWWSAITAVPARVEVASAMAAIKRLVDFMVQLSSFSALPIIGVLKTDTDGLAVRMHPCHTDRSFRVINGP
jgi:putative N-acetylmannosamine-6-phosphate epimerase